MEKQNCDSTERAKRQTDDALRFVGTLLHVATIRLQKLADGIDTNDLAAETLSAILPIIDDLTACIKELRSSLRLQA